MKTERTVWIMVPKWWQEYKAILNRIKGNLLIIKLKKKEGWKFC